MTLIFAPSKLSSLNEILIPDSFGVISLPPTAGQQPGFGLLAREHAFQLRHQCSGALRRHAAGMRSVQQQPHNRCVLGLGKLFGHLFEPVRCGTAHRQREYTFGKFGEAPETRAAPGQHEAGGNLRVQPGAFKIVTHQRKKLL